MKKTLLKSMALMMMLCVSTMSFAAIDWDSKAWLGNGADAQYANKYKIDIPDGVDVVNIQTSFGTEAGIYVTFPGDPISFCSLGEGKYAVQGRGMLLYMSAFTAQETEVQVTAAGVGYTLTVYYADGTVGGGEVDPEPTPEPEEPSEPALTAPDKAAPTPEWPEAQVKSVYSDAYTPLTVWNYCANWGQTTALSQESIESNAMLHYTNFNWVGLETIDQSGYNALDMEYLHIDIWTANDAKINFYPIYGGEGLATNDQKFKTLTLTGQQWNSFDIPLTDFADLDFSSIWQFKFADGTTTDFFVDNIYFYRTTAADADNEAPTNVSANVASESYFSVVIAVSAIDNSNSVKFTVKNNEDVVATGTARSEAVLNITVNNLTPNTEYTFSIVASDESGNEAEPITITANTLAAPAAAPAPTRNEEDVFSIYSDVYTTTVYRSFGWWGASTVEKEVQLAEGDNALLYTTSTYLGWELNGNSTIGDLTAYTHIHMDIYVQEEGSIQFTPVWGQEALKTYTLVSGWNQLDIVMADDFPACNMENIYQLKWNAMPATLFIDNVYFFKEDGSDTPTGLNAVDTEVRVQKFIENGQLIIMRDGIRYNAVGRMLGK